MPLFDDREIRTSELDHYEQAIGDTRDFLAKCKDEHPVHGWVRSTHVLMENWKRMPPQFEGPEISLDKLCRFADEVLMPASRLCRLATSLRDLELLTGAVDEELHSMYRENDFYHGEYVFFLATGISRVASVEVHLIKRRRKLKTPDLIVPSDKVVIECKERGRSSTDNPIDGQIAKADEQLAAFVSEQEEEWKGYTAIDYGYLGTPSLPESGKRGFNLDQLDEEIIRNFKSAHHTAAVIVTAQGVNLSRDRDDHLLIGPRHSSGSLQNPYFFPRATVVDRCFMQWPSEPEVAVRMNP